MPEGRISIYCPDCRKFHTIPDMPKDQAGLIMNLRCPNGRTILMKIEDKKVEPDFTTGPDGGKREPQADYLGR